jgi:hypothetical protein
MDEFVKTPDTVAADEMDIFKRRFRRPGRYVSLAGPKKREDGTYSYAVVVVQGGEWESGFAIKLGSAVKVAGNIAEKVNILVKEHNMKAQEDLEWQRVL